MDQQTREAVRRNHEVAAHDPRAWLWSATTLDASARVLQEHFVVDLQKASHDEIVATSRVEGPLLMLRACLIECILKATYVARGKKLVVDGRFRSPTKHPHDLVALAAAAEVALSETERALLEHLGPYIFMGRYPVPTQAPSDYARLAGGALRETLWSQHDEDTFRAVRKRLLEIVASLLT